MYLKLNSYTIESYFVKKYNMKNIIDALNWRYATKDFSPDKKVSESDIKTIKEAFRLSPSSYGVQPWKLVVVENKNLRQKLVEHSYGQKKVAEASHLFVLCRPSKFSLSYIDAFLDDIAKTRGVSRNDLVGYENMMKWDLGSKNEIDIKYWMEKQIYIALWNLMTVCATMGIDACPMEGFNPQKYNEILWLSDMWLSAVVLLTVWYRSDKDDYAKLAKVRFDEKDVIITL